MYYEGSRTRQEAFARRGFSGCLMETVILFLVLYCVATANIYAVDAKAGIAEEVLTLPGGLFAQLGPSNTDRASANSPRRNSMVTGYVYDLDLKKEVNAGNENYWYEYVKEICDQMGLKAKPVPPSVLLNPDALKAFDVLIMGGLPASCITEDVRRNLGAWVSEDGVLIGSAVDGLDDLFGIERAGITYQADDYAISAYFRFAKDELTEGIHSALVPHQEMLIFSDAHHVLTRDSKPLGVLCNLNREATEYSAITARAYGSGYAFYFAFDLAKTIWILHQGRPVTDDLDEDGILRTMELRVTGNNSGEVPYADELLLLLQNMIGRKRQPFIYAIPPDGDRIPDALFFWGGDDEGAQGSAVAASKWMKERGLPYHANILYKNGGFDFTPDEGEAMNANDHEYSLHYNFLAYKAPEHFSRTDVLEQSEAFYRKFGRHQICSVNHYAMWTGWTEPAEWILELGGQADNSFLSKYRLGEPTNAYPDIYLMGASAGYYYPRFCYGFGTSFPFYFYTDHIKGNNRIDFLELPITAYEMGYKGTNANDPVIFPEEIHKVVDIAIYYHGFINMFFHTYRIRDWAGCRNSIEAILDYIESSKLSIIHKSPDQLTEWWKARSKADIEDVTVYGDRISFSTDCDYGDGMIVKVPLGDAEAGSVTCDGSAVVYENRREYGQNWVYLISPVSRHDIEIAIR